MTLVFNYQHMSSPLRLPYRDTEELVLNGEGRHINYYAALPTGGSA